MSKRTASLAKMNEKGNHSLAKKRKLSGPGVSKSSHSPVHSILHLQRTAGNQEVQRLLKSGTIQAKLKIGKPNDKYEQEADRVADKVMSMPEPKGSLVNGHSSLVQREATCPECLEKEEIQTKPLVADQITPMVQRQADEEEELVQTKRIQRQDIEEEEPVQAKLLQRQEAEEEEEPVQAKLQRQAGEEEEEPVQAKPAPNQTPAITSNIEANVNSLKGGGQPLSESSRSFFEPRFGTDFSHVRVHKGLQASETAKSINARAFTTGNGKDVVFGAGQYSPGTSLGKRLLAHELTHMVQQNQKRRSTNFERKIAAQQFSHLSIRQGKNGQKSTSVTWTAWLWSKDGIEYNELRTVLEAAKYKFITHVKTGNKWEKKFPTIKTPASQVGWSIGTPEGKWKWATTANVVTKLRGQAKEKKLTSERFKGNAILRAVLNNKRTLRIGSKGEAVRLIQEFLLSQGYSLPKVGADGDFGKETEVAIKAFQVKHKLGGDGVVGFGTMGTIDTMDFYDRFSEEAGKIKKSGAKKAVVVSAQGDERPLTVDEFVYAFPIFGKSIDYKKIRINRDIIFGNPMAIGNTIYLQSDWGHFVGNTLNLTKSGRETLLHEMVHCWQYQVGGIDYIPEALYSYLKDYVTDYLMGYKEAYDWKKAHNSGKPWKSWTPDQQAEAIEEFNKKLRVLRGGKATLSDIRTLRILKPYVDNVRKRKGAP